MLRCVVMSIVLIAGVAVGFSGDEVQPAEVVTTSDDSEPNVVPVGIGEARRQATVLHETYVAILFAVHREYFDEKARDTLPARVFEDVFKDIDARTKGSTRWISVNTPAMNVDHKPKPGFETSAAAALANGKVSAETVSNGMYSRAAAVPFAASCSKCHQSALGHRRAGRMAGLVISLPVASQTPGR